MATGLEDGSDFVYVWSRADESEESEPLINRFNCQMGRGRTTTGMIVASLIATIQMDNLPSEIADDLLDESYDPGHGTEAEQYLDGEYKTILQLVTVLSHGKRTFRAASDHYIETASSDQQRPNGSRTRQSIRWRACKTCAKQSTREFMLFTRSSASRF